MSSTAKPSSSTNNDKASDNASSTVTGWKDKACRVCDSFSFFKKSMSHQGASSTDQPDNPANPSTSDDAWTNPDDALPCPPDYTDLGNSAWAFLHTVASYYPEQPTEQVAGPADLCSATLLRRRNDLQRSSCSPPCPASTHAARVPSTCASNSKPPPQRSAAARPLSSGCAGCTTRSTRGWASRRLTVHGLASGGAMGRKRGATARELLVWMAPYS